MKLSFDEFIDLYKEELKEIWTSSVHYFLTDYGKFLELKYDSYIKRGKLDVKEEKSR